MSRWGLVSLFVSLLLVACSGDTEVTTQNSPPSTTHYAVDFPSTAVAATTETLQVYVFDATDPSKGTDCLSLLTKRKAGGDLPATLTTTNPQTLCDLVTTSAATNQAGMKGALSITYGARSFLLVTQRGSQDYFLGCTTKTVSAADSTIDIPISPASSTTVIPASTCASLADHCSGKC